VVALSVATVGGGIAWGRPRLTWSFRPSDNRLMVSLAPGHGPLASWLLGAASLSVDGHRAAPSRPQRLVRFLRPGRTSRVTAVVTSVWSTAEHLHIRVPPAPALVATSLGPDEETLRFSMPVTVDGGPCGPGPTRRAVTTVVLSRRSSACSGTLQLVAASGEQSRVAVSVPPLPPPPPPPPSDLPAPVVSFGPATGGAYYITIDDGTVPDPAVLALMTRYHVPITAFLVSSIAARDLPYWRAFAAAGGEIEDHTVTHPDLTALSEQAAEEQWAGAARDFTAWFGTAPTLGRPPYGAVDRAVRVAASEARLRDVVLWSASMYDGQLTTYDHRPLRAGEIVILHWIPGLYASLVRLLAIAAMEGLHPAPLAAALSQAGP